MIKQYNIIDSFLNIAGRGFGYNMEKESGSYLLMRGTPTWDLLQVSHGVQLDKFYLQLCVKKEIKR